MQLGGRLPLFIELPRGPVFSESHVQNCEYGEKHTLPSAPISVLGKNFSKPPSKGLEAAEVGPVPWDAQGSTRTHNGIEHHPSWHPNLRSGSSLPTGLPVYLILGNLASGITNSQMLGGHPVTVKLRSKPRALQTDLRAEGRRRLPKHIFSAARCI